MPTENWRIRSYLLALVLAMVLPLWGLLLYSSLVHWRSDLRFSSEAVRSLASNVAADSERLIRNAQEVLAGLAQRPAIRAASTASAARSQTPVPCDPILADFKQFVPQLANIAQTNRDGQIICSALNRSNTQRPSVTAMEWFQQARVRKDFLVGTPHIGPVSGKWVVVLAQPILNAADEFDGVLGYAINLASFAPISQRLPLQAERQLQVINRAGIVVASSQPTDIGRPHPARQQLLQLDSARADSITVTLNGSEQLLGYAPIQGTDWLVLASQPAQTANSDAFSAALHSGLLSLLIFGVGLLAALRIGRHIIKPMEALEATTQAITAGDLSQRGPQQQGPLELRHLATAFNTMVDVRLRADARYRALLEAATDAIIIMDPSQRISFANPRACALFGYTLDELQGQPLNTLIPDSARPQHHDLVAAYLHAPQLSKQQRRDLHGKHRDGSLIPVEIGLSPLHSPEGVYVTAIIRDVSERRRYEDKLHHLANYDQLTGLPNRHHFRQHLKEATQVAQLEGRRLALFFLDVDRFKNINDTLGHLCGDQVLHEVAQRLQAGLRQEPSLTLIAHLGGDEFLLLQENIDSEQDAIALAGKTHQLFQQPLAIGGHEIYITVSIGITLFPDDASDIETLVKNADVAMYRSKGEGRNTFRCYRPTMDAEAHQRLLLETQLRSAIERGQLSLHYQPQLRQDGSIYGAEALLRWHHPEQGQIPPARFIPIAEESGLINEIGTWVLHQACRQAAEWQRAGLDLQVAVNLSAHQFCHREIARQVADILAHSGLPPQRLELEITESVLMADPDMAAAHLRQLRQQGVRVALDDFGTGYSSLAYLQQLPVSLLKIDQSFVRQLHDGSNASSVIAAIIALSRAYGIEVIAEGVETEAQRQHLADLTCDYFQGYLFSRPLPLPEFLAFARANYRGSHAT